MSLELKSGLLGDIDDHDDIQMKKISHRKKIGYFSRLCTDFISTRSFLVLVIVILSFMLISTKASTPAECHQIKDDLRYERRAYVTLLIANPTYSQKLYSQALIIWIGSLQYFKVKDDIVAMYTEGVDQSTLDTLKLMNVKLKKVKELQSTGNGELYKSMVTKFHLWNMREYDQIAYYDSDHIFFKDPSSVFSECGTNAFCSSQDQGMSTPYFNAGFMVIRPNGETYNNLIAHKELVNNRGLAEQDMLNDWYGGKWKDVGVIHNFMRFTKEELEKRTDVVCVHGKVWGFIDKDHNFVEDHWMWNRLIKNMEIHATYDFIYHLK